MGHFPPLHYCILLITTSMFSFFVHFRKEAELLYCNFMDNFIEGSCLSDLFNEEEKESASVDGLRTNSLELTPTAVVVRVYYLGRIISRVFQEENLHYWTSGGLDVLMTTWAHK